MSENMLQDIQEVLFTEEQIAKMVERVGQRSPETTRTKTFCWSAC